MFLCILILLLCPLAAASGQQPVRAWATVTGRVVDGETTAPVGVAEVKIEGTGLRAVTDTTGYYLLRGVPPGPHILLVSALGYADSRVPISVPATGILRQDVSLALRPLEVEGLIVIADPSARAEGELGTASVVGREAIANQTATSLRGITELIPGQVIQPPGLATVEQIAIRAVPTSPALGLTVGGPSATDIATFGTLIVLDGVPLSNNANLQTLGPRGELRVATSAGGGIDLRRVPASTLERVEVVRGVPSSRYGDLTQGVVIIETRAAAVEPTVTARYDNHTLEGSFVVGRQLGARQTGIASFDIANTEVSPGVSDDQTTRIAGQLSHRARLGSGGGTVLDTRVDYFQIYEDNPEDPEVLPGKASWNRDWGLRISERAGFPAGSRASLSLTASLDYVRQRSYAQSLLVRGAMPFTDRIAEGRSVGRFILGEYLSRLWVEGDQWQLYGRLEGARMAHFLGAEHDLRGGLELRREWNTGPGYLFDVEFPPQITFNGVQGFDRPYSFDEVPAMATSTAYLDDRLLAILPRTMPLELQLGFRLDLLHNGGHWFSGIRDAVLQPRINAQLTTWPWLRLRAAWGRTAKLPPLSQLYPPLQYYDVVNVNWYAVDPAERLAVLTTFIRDPTNDGLGFATSRKAEVGFELVPGQGGVGISIVAFSNSTTGAVGYRNIPGFLTREHFQLSDSTPGTGVPPEIIEPASYADTVPTLTDLPDNNLTLDNKGVEVVLDLPELRVIRTRLNLQATWTETTFFKDGLDFGQQFSSFQVSERVPRAPYWLDPIRKGNLGLLTYRLVHHQPALGLVLTGTLQHTFRETAESIAGTDTLAFAGYITRSGELVPVPPEQRGDPEFEDLRSVSRSSQLSDFSETPPDWIASLQVSKTLPRGGRLSFYAFNVFDNPGAYSATGFGARFYPRLRFGIEVSLPLGGPHYVR